MLNRYQVENHRIEAVAETCRRSLYEFVKRSWHVVEPGTVFVDNWHVKAMCDHLEAVTSGNILKLLINIAPGLMKSLLTCVFWPAWEWTNDPTLRSQFGSYDEGLAVRDSVRTRDLILSDWYQLHFDPTWRLKPDANEKSYFVNTQQGARRSFGMNGKVTGFRADKLVIDDPLNARDRYSRNVKELCINIFDKVLSTRVNDPRQARFVVIMQRLAYDDLAGHLLEVGGYEHLCLPSEFDPKRKAFTSIGWEDPRTEPGELLFPEFHTAEVLRGLREDTLGSDDYEGQHQQNPVPTEGGGFKDGWWQYWEWQDERAALIRLHGKDGWTELIRLDQCRMFATVDPAVGLKEKNDPTDYGIWAVTPASKMLLLIDDINERMEEPESIQRALGLKLAWPRLQQFVVEDNGVGRPLAQNLRNEGLAVKSISMSVDKLVASTTARVRSESGRVFLPSGAQWLPVWKTELHLFPNGNHDDRVTGISLAAEEVFPGEASIVGSRIVPVQAVMPGIMRGQAPSRGLLGKPPSIDRNRR